MQSYKKENPSVFGIVASGNGCDYYRLIQPFMHLKENGHRIDWAPPDIARKVPLSKYDIFVFPRVGLPIVAERERAFELAKENNVKIVYELDDDLTTIPDWSPAHPEPEEVENGLAMIRKADMVTVSTGTLAKVMRQYNPNVVILENCIDPDMWSFPKDKNRHIDGLTIGIQGSATHLKDWEVLEPVFRVLAEKYPEIKFVTAGYTPPYLNFLGDRLIELGWVPVSRYPQNVNQIDIGVCPLIDIPFNRSKSAIKWMEYSMVQAPSVCSPTVYGSVVQHGVTGFLAKTEEDWVKYLSRLIEKPKLRREIASNARGYVLRHLNIHDRYPRWMAAYRTVWQKTKA
jgi:glycosyltransferase involved in cell wall biosynthesis